MTLIYENNDRIMFRARVASTAETNVFICPYGFGIRFKLLKLSIYNEAGTATSVKIFDHHATVAVTDPPAQGDATTPLMTVSVATIDSKDKGLNECPALVFNQGMAVVASQGTIVVTATVIEV